MWFNDMHYGYCCCSYKEDAIVRLLWHLLLYPFLSSSTKEDLLHIKTFSYLWHSFYLSPGIAICICFCNIYSFSKVLICDQLLISTEWGSLLMVCWTAIMSYSGNKTISTSPLSSGWVSISLHAQSSCFIRFFLFLSRSSLMSTLEAILTTCSHELALAHYTASCTA